MTTHGYRTTWSYLCGLGLEPWLTRCRTGNRRLSGIRLAEWTGLLVVIWKGTPEELHDRAEPRVLSAAHTCAEATGSTWTAQTI